MMFKLLFFYFICIFNLSLGAENFCNTMLPRGGGEDWGSGAIISSRPFRVIVYSESNGMPFGELSKADNGDFSFRNFETMKNAIDVSKEIDYIGHVQNEILKVKECYNQDFIQLFWKNSKNELYISKKDLEKLGPKYLTYKKILVEQGLNPNNKELNFNIGVNLSKNCLNLRISPRLSSLKILCIQSNAVKKKFTTVIRIIKLQGEWANVEYFELYPAKNFPTNDEDCYSVKKNSTIGWVKAIADNGFPNIWFSAGNY